MAKEDFLGVCARRLLYLGLLLSSLLSIRVGGGQTAGDICLLASAALLAVAIGQPKLKVLGNGWTYMALLLIVIGGLLASARADSGGGSIQIVLRLTYLVGVLPWQLRNLLTTRARLERGAYFWFIGAAICGAGTLAQYAFGPNLLPGTHISNAGRYTGFTQNVSDVGGIAAVGVVFAVAGFTRWNTTRRTWLCLLGLVGAGAGLMLSGSVSGLLAVTVAVLFLVLRRGISVGRAVLLTIIVTFSLTFVGNIQNGTANALTPLQRIEQVLGRAAIQNQQGLNTSASRLETDRAGWNGFIAHPLIGRGLDPSSAIVLRDQDLAVHNILIGAAYQGGIFVFLGILIALIISLQRGWVRDRRHPIGMQIYVALVASAIFAMTAPSSYNRYLWIPVALVLTFARLRDIDELGEPIERVSARKKRSAHLTRTTPARDRALARAAAARRSALAKRT